MRSALFALLAALLLVGGLPATTPVAQAGPALERTEKRIIKLHNKARAAKGIKRTLKANNCLDGFAERQARRQARKTKLYHQDLSPIIRACGRSIVGENVAYGYPTAGKVHRAWMSSKGHRANILKRKFNKIGVGMALSKKGVPYYVAVFGRR